MFLVASYLVFILLAFLILKCVGTLWFLDLNNGKIHLIMFSVYCTYSFLYFSEVCGYSCIKEQRVSFCLRSKKNIKIEKSFFCKTWIHFLCLLLMAESFLLCLYLNIKFSTLRYIINALYRGASSLVFVSLVVWWWIPQATTMINLSL